jgi:hypothetical protein
MASMKTVGFVDKGGGDDAGIGLGGSGVGLGGAGAAAAEGFGADGAEARSMFAFCPPTSP